MSHSPKALLAAFIVLASGCVTYRDNVPVASSTQAGCSASEVVYKHEFHSGSAPKDDPEYVSAAQNLGTSLARKQE